MINLTFSNYIGQPFKSRLTDIIIATMRTGERGNPVMKMLDISISLSNINILI